MAIMTKQIRAKCMDCCCDQQAEVARCDLKKCALWGYRFGCSPHSKTFIEKHGEGWDWNKDDKIWERSSDLSWLE